MQAYEEALEHGTSGQVAAKFGLNYGCDLQVLVNMFSPANEDVFTLFGLQKLHYSELLRNCFVEVNVRPLNLFHHRN